MNCVNCGNKTERVLCERCTANYWRQQNLEDVYAEELTGAESSQIACDAQNLVAAMGMDEVRAHISELKRTMQVIRLHMLEASERRAKLQVEHDFTPEEYEAFKASARKRPTRAASDDKPKGDKTEKAITTLMKMLNLSREQAEAMVKG